MNSFIPVIFLAFMLFAAAWLFAHNNNAGGTWIHEMDHDGDLGLSCDEKCNNYNLSCIDDLYVGKSQSDNQYWPCVQSQVEYATKIDQAMNGAFCNWQYLDTEYYPVTVAPESAGVTWGKPNNCYFRQDFHNVAQVGKCATNETGTNRLCWCVDAKYDSHHPPPKRYRCP